MKQYSFSNTQHTLKFWAI